MKTEQPSPVDIECPRCHRISFAGESNPACEVCHWMIRPPFCERPFGFDVLIEVSGGTICTKPIERHYKGSESKARSAAKRVRNFRRVLAVAPLSEETWVRTYGTGYEKWG